MRQLGLKGVIINSHTRGEMLDDPKFWEIFEAAEALNVPIYIHPQAPSAAMIGPYVEARARGRAVGLRGRDRTPRARHHPQRRARSLSRLRLVVGHLGEALPFWLFRLDYMNRTARPAIRSGAASLEKRISDYMKENVFITTSGMAWAPAITFVQSVLGMDRVMYAMDYPYQFELDEVDRHRRRADRRRGQEEAVSDERGDRVFADVRLKPALRSHCGEGRRGVHDLPAEQCQHGFDPSNRLLGHGEIVVAEDRKVRVLACDERADVVVVEGKPRRALRIQAKRFDPRNLLAVVGQHARHVPSGRHVEERDPRIESRDVGRIRADAGADS